MSDNKVTPIDEKKILNKEKKDQPEQVSEEQLDAIFNEEYKQLCEMHKRMISVQPIFKLRDDGTYSVVVITSVKRLNR